MSGHGSYYREDEVARLILSWWQWHGDGPRGSSSAARWAAAFIEARDLRREFRSSMRIVVLGVDARRTGLALQRMRGDLRRALVVFHTSSLTFAMQARDLMSVSRSHYHRLLLEAHPVFLERYEEEAKAGVALADAYAATAARSSGAVDERPFYRPRVGEDDDGA